MQEKNIPYVKNILLALASHVKVKGIRGIANYLGMPESSLYSWISRNKIGDTTAILRKIPNARIEWIETGKGDMFQEGVTGPLSVKLVLVWDTVPAGWPDEMSIVMGEPVDYIPVSGNGRNMGALLVEGHSMSPEIRDGEYVLYVQEYNIKPGDWIVATDEFQRSMVKEYAIKDGEPWLVSINPEYPSFKVNSHYRIIGRVIDIYSRRKARRRG